MGHEIDPASPPGPGRCRESRPYLPGILFIDALDVEAHAEHLTVRRDGRACIPHPCRPDRHRHLKRLQLAGGEGGLGVFGHFFTSSGMLV